MRQKCILVITDGIGFNKEKDFNAFEAAKSQIMRGFLEKYQIL